MSAPYNVNFGNTYTPYGTKPAQIGLPPSTYTQANQADPNFGAETSQASGLINSELSGQLTPAMREANQNSGASWGYSSGMPGSGAAQNRWDTSNMSSIYNMQNQGLQNYNTYAKTLESGQVDPTLMASIAEHNAATSAAPDPSAAHSAAQNDYWQSLLISGGLGIGGMLLGGPIGGLAGGLLGSLFTGGGGTGIFGGGGGSSKKGSSGDWAGELGI